MPEQRDEMIRRSLFPVFCLFIISALGVINPARALDEPSFAEWRGVMEKAFRNFQGQEDKLLDADSARILTWEKGLRTSARPENSAIEAERKRDPQAVAALEACRNALLLIAVLRLKAQGLLQPGRDNPLNIDGDIPFDQYARLYIGFAETCEGGLHLPSPANAFRTRYR
jgi:hypothetical protein